MLLLDSIIDQGPDCVRCQASVRADCPLVDPHGMPAWALPEHIAQAAAVLRGLAGGDTQRTGYLAALSEVSLSGPEHVPVGALLEVSARRCGPARDSMALLEGEVRRGGQVICLARLVVKEDPG